MSEDEFWRDIDGDESFWERLPQLDHCMDLIDGVMSVSPDDTLIVSAPSRCLTSHIGKHRWLDRALPEESLPLILTPDKHRLAVSKHNPVTVLIDDREVNIRKFIESGGYGIIFPKEYNSLTQYANDPVEYVTNQLHSIHQRSK